ncbi:AraC family transcriptional regulator [Phaeodactylibacter xiamenensis]|jgi:AraC-like DNA-binding protein|uniref:AraC family transcriptional regulator n=1 Tax=Phaeodactylibacter xiamenensis TaxID=1524460 RepID=A0A098SCC3_9BACT|nr:AraC family transcriptional regulator [Phaeodactylibacter xiamenensis]KGE88692.1 AraC family transcriptional regulator [Phaeodactylibacter xiamenensis]MCR9051966.1 AraC family transcriptional regulator [bacterium]
MQLPQNFSLYRRLDTLVENKTSFTMEQAEVNVFETHQQAEEVLLKFHQPVFASMIRGKKVMKLREQPSFEFLPGESLLLPADETMCINFPEAEIDNPTHCLAMTLSEDQIRKTIQSLNESAPKGDGEEWAFTPSSFHFTNTVAIKQIIQRLLFLCTEDHPSKDLFANLMLQELIVRILQAEARANYIEQGQVDDNNRLSFAIRFIREHLGESLTVEQISQKVYMSESNFYRVFKDHFGVTPVEFINNERIKLARRMLEDPTRKVQDVYLSAGFNSGSYFNRVFKRKYGLSPKAYREQVMGKC